MNLLTSTKSRVNRLKLLYLLQECGPLLESASWHRRWLPGRQSDSRESSSASAFDELSATSHPLRRPASQCTASLCHQITDHSPRAHPSPPPKLTIGCLASFWGGLGCRPTFRPPSSPWSQQRPIDRTAYNCLLESSVTKAQNIQEFPLIHDLISRP